MLPCKLIYLLFRYKYYFICMFLCLPSVLRFVYSSNAYAVSSIVFSLNTVNKVHYITLHYIWFGFARVVVFDLSDIFDIGIRDEPLCNGRKTVRVLFMLNDLFSSHLFSVNMIEKMFPDKKTIPQVTNNSALRHELRTLHQT